MRDLLLVNSVDRFNILAGPDKQRYPFMQRGRRDIQDRPAKLGRGAAQRFSATKPTEAFAGTAAFHGSFLAAVRRIHVHAAVQERTMEVGNQ